MKQPVPPDARRQPLPEQRPKPGSEDPQAPANIRAILDSPSYQEADRNLDFLRREDMRGIRLLLDYLKPQTLLGEQDVAHTIVVFGSTRIPEPAAARRAVEAATAALATSPDDTALRSRLKIAQRILAKSKYYETARALGRLVGRCGDLAIGGRVMVTTGGGLNITLPHEQYPNPYITPELCFNFRYFAMRKLHFLLRARALVAFPGGFGTLDELFEVLTLSQTRKIAPVPVILVGEEYWRRVFDPDFLVAEGVIDPEDADLFWYAETAEEIWRGILTWYDLKGEPLLPSDLIDSVCQPA